MNFWYDYCNITKKSTISVGYRKIIQYLFKIYLGKCYILILGIFGAIISGFDVTRLMFCHKKIPEGLKRDRLKNVCISTVHERDMKLLFSTLHLEFFILLSLSVITCTPVLVLPWLTMHSTIIIGETILFLTFLMDGHFCIKKWETIARCIFAIFNWIQVFCLFIKIDKSDCSEFISDNPSISNVKTLLVRLLGDAKNCCEFMVMKLFYCICERFRETNCT